MSKLTESLKMKKQGKHFTLKILAVIFLPVVICVTGVFVYLYTGLPNLEEAFSDQVDTLTFTSSRGDVVYLKKVTRGLNYCRYYISASGGAEFDSTADYVNSSDYNMFYKFSGDTLYVYPCGKFYEPEKFVSSVAVKQVILSPGRRFKPYEDYTDKGVYEF